MTPAPGPLYKVEIKLCHGKWDDAGWTVDDEPQRFETEAAAWKEIDDLIEDTREAFKRGDLGSPYIRSDFRVVPDFAEYFFRKALPSIPRKKKKHL